MPVLVTVLAWPIRRVSGVSGSLGADNASRLPARTAATAAALMIGVALASFMAIFANVMAGTQSQQLDKSVRADYVVTSTTDYQPFDGSIARRIASVPGVAVVARDADEISRAGGAPMWRSASIPPRSRVPTTWTGGRAPTPRSPASAPKDAVMEETIARSEGLRSAIASRSRLPRAGTRR